VIWVLAVIAMALLAGWPAARLLGMRDPWSVTIGAAFLLGAAIISFSLFLLSLLGVVWDRPPLLTILFAITCLLWWRALETTREETASPEQSSAPGSSPLAPRPSSLAPRRLLPLVIAADLLTLLLVVGHGLFATAAAPFETDFIFIWGLKAHVFAENRGIDWEFIASPWNVFSHPDYPLLIPLLYDAVAVLAGEWNDRWLGLLTTAFSVAALLCLRGMLRRELPAALAAAMTLALAAMLLTPWIGMAEGPLIAYATVALLLIRQGVREQNQLAMTAGAVFLAAAAMTKNEGIALIVAVTAALIVAAGNWRSEAIRRLWPAFLAAGGWFLIRIAMGLGTDLTTGSPLARAAGADLGEMFRLLWTYTAIRPLLWLGLGLGVLITLPDLFRKERFILITFVLQLGFYIAAYLVTPHQLDWHVRWSWPRLMTHLLPLLTLALLFSLSRVVMSLMERWMQHRALDPVFSSEEDRS
jgi:hypothetical protein